MNLETMAGIDLGFPPTFAVVYVEPNGHWREAMPFQRASELGGSVVWHREQDETQDDSKQRVMADARKGKRAELHRRDILDCR
jgi:hypothetical protein